MHPRWVHGFSIASPQLIAELDARKQQIGQLELLAAAAAYISRFAHGSATET
jgi:sugar phosphate permease